LVTWRSRTGTAALDGPATSYYESGKVKGKTTYRLGVPTGHGVVYYENGQLKEEIDYAAQGRDRKVVRYYDAPGQPRQAEEQYKSNRPAGTWREFYPDGKTPRQVETYAATGKLTGERLSYFDNGKVQIRQEFDVNGLQTGVGQEFYASGQPRKEANYLKGLLAGEFHEFHDDGSPAVSGLYKNGKQSGQWTYYKADGHSIERQVTYRDGKPAGAGTRAKLNGKPYVAPPKRK
jgi:antitoxin component YwqK of YwqJK toxin-antitoxin module